MKRQQPRWVPEVQVGTVLYGQKNGQKKTYTVVAPVGSDRSLGIGVECEQGYTDILHPGDYDYWRTRIDGGRSPATHRVAQHLELNIPFKACLLMSKYGNLAYKPAGHQQHVKPGLGAMAHSQVAPYYYQAVLEPDQLADNNVRVVADVIDTVYTPNPSLFQVNRCPKGPGCGPTCTTCEGSGYLHATPGGGGQPVTRRELYNRYHQAHLADRGQQLDACPEVVRWVDSIPAPGQLVGEPGSPKTSAPSCTRERYEEDDVTFVRRRRPLDPSQAKVEALKGDPRAYKVFDLEAEGYAERALAMAAQASRASFQATLKLMAQTTFTGPGTRTGRWHLPSSIHPQPPRPPRAVIDELAATPSPPTDLFPQLAPVPSLLELASAFQAGASPQKPRVEITGPSDQHAPDVPAVGSATSTLAALQGFEVEG